MLSSIIKIFIIPLLLALFVQDYRHRTIHVLNLVLIIVGVLVLSYTEKRLSLHILLANFSFMVIQLVFLFLYVYIKFKRPALLFKKYIGLGDILFWIVPAVYLGFAEYVFFSLLSYLLILIFFSAFILISKRQITIPLAGVMALFFCIYLLVTWHNPDVLELVINKYYL